MALQCPGSSPLLPHPSTRPVPGHPPGSQAGAAPSQECSPVLLCPTPRVCCPSMCPTLCVPAARRRTVRAHHQSWPRLVLSASAARSQMSRYPATVSYLESCLSLGGESRDPSPYPSGGSFVLAAPEPQICSVVSTSHPSQKASCDSLLGGGFFNDAFPLQRCGQCQREGIASFLKCKSLLFKREVGSEVESAFIAERK